MRKGEKEWRRVLKFRFEGRVREFLLIEAGRLRNEDVMIYDNLSDPELVSGEREVRTGKILDVRSFGNYVEVTFVTGEKGKGEKIRSLNPPPPKNSRHIYVLAG